MYQLQISVTWPKDHVGYSDIVERVRQVVRVTGRRATQFAKRKAPGKVLRRRIDYTEEKVDGGLISRVMMPDKLRFTLPPGTQPHFIPGGLAVTSRLAAQAIQKAKGYPLRFYWEKVGAVVTPWAVKHPGYRPTTDWGLEVEKYAEMIAQQELAKLQEYIDQRWGGQVVVEV